MTKISIFGRIKKKITSTLENSSPSTTNQTASTTPTNPNSPPEPTATPSNYEGSFVDKESPLETLTKSEKNRNLLDKFREEQRDKTIFESWKNEYLICQLFLKYFLSFISMIGAFCYFYNQFKIIDMPTLAKVIAFALVAIIAAFQHFVLPKAASKIVKGAMLGSLGLLVVSFALSVVSIQSSTLGNADLVANAYDKYAPKAAKADIKTDSTDLANNKIKLIENDGLISLYMGKANTKKNTDFMTAKKNENVVIRAENKEIQKRIDIAKAEAKAVTNENKGVHKADKAAVASTIFKVSIVNEFLILMVFLFIAWYEMSSVTQLELLEKNKLTVWQYRTGLKIVPLTVQQTGMNSIAQAQNIALPANISNSQLNVLGLKIDRMERLYSDFLGNPTASFSQSSQPTTSTSTNSPQQKPTTKKDNANASKSCEVCNRNFTPKRNARYCSATCRSRNHRSKKI